MHDCSQMASVLQYQFKATRPWLLCCMVHLLAQVRWHIVDGACRFNGNGVPNVAETPHKACMCQAYTHKAHMVLNVSDGGHLYAYVCNVNIYIYGVVMYVCNVHVHTKGAYIYI